MTATRILSGLETLDLTGEDAATAARLGFLEWVFTQAGEATAKEARLALDALGPARPESAAARAFLGYLRQATVPVLPTRGRLGRARRLH